MATPTFNSGIDYFGLAAGTSPALAVGGSAENRTKQSASGKNTFGDTAVADSYGESAQPSAEYTVVGAVTTASFPHLGSVHEVEGLDCPVVMGSVTISTQSGQPPKVSVSGQMVQPGAAQLRDYPLPDGIAVSNRHRAQDFLGAMVVKCGDEAASPVNDYGLESVSATFPIEFTLAQPKGVLKNYDLHGGDATAQYVMNWYRATPPTIELSQAAAAAGYTMSAPVSRSDPEGGYTQYAWTLTLPMKGAEKD